MPTALALSNERQVGIGSLFPGTVRRVSAGADIYAQGDYVADVFLLRTGWAFLYQVTADGRRQILHFALPGEILNYNPGLRHPAIEGAQAITAGAISSLSRHALDQILERSPIAARQVADSAELRRMLVFEHLTNLGRRCARERLANILLELFCRVRGRLPSVPEDRAPLPLTQSILADAVGLTPIHVNRTLRRLRQERIVCILPGVVRVLNPAKLVELAGLTNEVPRVLTTMSRPLQVAASSVVSLWEAASA